MENQSVKRIAEAVKLDSFALAAATESIRNVALKAIANALAEHKDGIIAANEKDLRLAEQSGIASPILKRLKFDETKLGDVIRGIEDLIDLPDPVGRKLSRRQLDDNLILEKVSCPIGVIGVIFESRPDALVQIVSLCLKSGNCAILKGGSEAQNTNKALFDAIYDAGIASGLPKGFLTLLQSREDIGELLQCHESIDLIIPRGSNEFVRYIMNHSEIPVMGHADGICHIYVDKAADIEKAIPIILDSKTQYVAACNAVETVLVHEDIAKDLLPPLAKALKARDVSLYGCARAMEILSDIAAADETAYFTEYLDYTVNLKVLANLDEAIDHINRYGSHHTDCILTEDTETAEKFMQRVDSAGVYQNCSTRFADGFRYGFGAEVGISTGKLHARGPVGLEGLSTYKYKLFGDGQIVDDYATGKKTFHFKELS
ncbi:MAG: glutamate-5-semialdehyde dehydrogenase [Clostridiales Family XIII bacterium]|jgi:glutamate-5-semialdehyde dehydrogenase|nr:glutamate-5-semialdehyde dehydrogenase [Clostridiales Family XIII bacterium]